MKSINDNAISTIKLLENLMFPTKAIDLMIEFNLIGINLAKFISIVPYASDFHIVVKNLLNFTEDFSINSTFILPGLNTNRYNRSVALLKSIKLVNDDNLPHTIIIKESSYESKFYSTKGGKLIVYDIVYDSDGRKETHKQCIERPIGTNINSEELVSSSSYDVPKTLKCNRVVDEKWVHSNREKTYLIDKDKNVKYIHVKENGVKKYEFIIKHDSETGITKYLENDKEVFKRINISDNSYREIAYVNKEYGPRDIVYVKDDNMNIVKAYCYELEGIDHSATINFEICSNGVATFVELEEPFYLSTYKRRCSANSFGFLVNKRRP